MSTTTPRGERGNEDGRSEALRRADAGVAAWRGVVHAPQAAPPDPGEFYELAGFIVETLRVLEALAGVPAGSTGGGGDRGRPVPARHRRARPSAHGGAVGRGQRARPDPADLPGVRTGRLRAPAPRPVPCPAVAVACLACRRRCGGWAGEGEGTCMPECTIPAPCEVLRALAAHYRITRTDTGEAPDHPQLPGDRS